MKNAILATFTLTFLLTASAAFGFGRFGDEVNAYCPSSDPYTGDCTLCHTGSKGDPTPMKDAYLEGDLGYFCPATAPIDLDNDGFTVEQGDCNDNDPLSYPGGTEYCNDGADNNCNGRTDCLDNNCSTDPSCVTCTDQDNDSYAIEGGDCGPVDCKDSDLSVNPGAVELCNDGADNDCDGLSDCEDADCNGDDACAGICIPEASKEKGKKCKDGIDNDCDGLADAEDSDCVRTKGGETRNGKKK
jgi:hypothetical protein